MATGSGAAPRNSKRRRGPTGPAGVRAAPGWTALAQARWKAARTAFEGALKHEESPELLEGLSWAAWWLDDADAVFDARARAYRLYRTRGDVACAARMATWLAADHLDFHAAFAVTNGWLQRARRLLETVELGPDHGWLAFHEGYVAFVQGDLMRSSELARSASELGRRFDVADLEMLGLALEGAALVACARVQEGMHRLDEATTTALESEASIPISRAWACCFLVTACEAVRDYSRAFEWCDRIAEFAERYGNRYMLGFCRQHYAAVHMWRGQWQEAEAQFEAAIDAYSRSRPAFAGRVLAGLAELRRRQGRWKDAEQLLDQAETSDAVLVCRSRLARDRGDAQRALALAERALRQTPENMTVQRVPTLEALIAAATDLRQWSRAHAALAELKALARVVDTEPLRAAVNLAQGTLAAATREQEQARRLLEDAVDGFERSGAPFEAAEARLELSKSLSALGWVADAAEERRTALARLRELGVDADERLARGRVDAAPAVSRQRTPVSEISPRERDVLRCLAEGLTNRQIAERLFVSEHTIHRHITSILRKLDLPTRTAAAAHALRAGLLDSSTT